MRRAADGATIGEILLRGNTVMKGYLKNPKATDEAFAGGWFHTGDLARHAPDGYVEIKDRSKDIIISGGENISSIEVEEALYRHPAVLEAAVVARPDEKWGETPCAFVTLKDRAPPTAAEIIAFCRERLARISRRRARRLRAAAQDLDRQDPEIRAASIIDTNLTGMMRVGQAVARSMAARGQGGAIVNVASILGLRAAAQLAPYAAAKAGVISLTQTMALELARHRIRVNALAPGYIETDLNRDFLRSPAGQTLARRVPMRRFGEPSDLDGPLLLLAAEAGGFMTGVTLPVDGGHLLSFL
jgi:NAD(P)-dependent dehydrogenase (short-subunit alcohol dehydrogenase family)